MEGNNNSMRFTAEEVETIKDALYFVVHHNPFHTEELDLVYKIKRRQRKK